MSTLTFIKILYFNFFSYLQCSPLCETKYTKTINHTCLNMSRRARPRKSRPPPDTHPLRHPLDMLPSPVGRRGREQRGAGASTVTFTLNKFEHLHGEYLYGEVQYIMGNGQMRLSPPPPLPPLPSIKKQVDSGWVSSSVITTKYHWTKCYSSISLVPVYGMLNVAARSA